MDKNDCTVEIVDRNVFEKKRQGYLILGKESCQVEMEYSEEELELEDCMKGKVKNGTSGSEFYSTKDGSVIGKGKVL